ncbi:MAG: lytic transglycosylase domain-containing protein, partial [Glaciimonas sp.]|nr:lytic transglycosylase domain-containing protein [Glaciimonas sp.]
MMSRKERFPTTLKVIACAALMAAIFPTAVNAQTYASPHDAFTALRTASRAAKPDKVDKVEALASTLTDYDIPSYVDYYRLKPRIKDLVAPESEIRNYLKRYDGTAIGDRLRNDWALELGKAGDWKNFDQQYPLFVLDDDTQLKCYALISKALKGGNVADDARALLITPKEYGQGCTDLVGTLAQNKQFSQSDVWAQIRLASESGYAGIARRMAPYVDANEAQIGQAIDKPGLVLPRGPGADRVGHELFIVALGRAAKNNPSQAANALTVSADQLTASERALGWAQIAQQASLKLDPQAADYWRAAKGVPLSNDGYQWSVRAALRAGDWKQVKGNIEAMPPSLRGDVTWIYWLGRALRAEGKSDEAQKLFQSIASQNNFYGQLATEELGQKIFVSANSAAITKTELAPMVRNAGFRRAMRFFDMDLRFEGTREWNWELRGMTDRQLLAAAEFARQSDVLDRMVNTSDRTKMEIDYTQRFPSPHSDIMKTNTQALGLDMA